MTKKLSRDDGEKTGFNLSRIALIIFACIAAISVRAQDISVITLDSINWGLLNPLRGDASPKAANLWGDRKTDAATGMLVKFKEGFSSPPHSHNVAYRAVVIEGLIHNDDPSAEQMWLPRGSFWTQPAGENHVTAANGQTNLIYLEIDSGPYLVLPEKDAFDSGEHPINLHSRNLLWLDANAVRWLGSGKANISFLWGNPNQTSGSFVKLPAGFDGAIRSDAAFKAVVVSGSAMHHWRSATAQTLISPGSFIQSTIAGQHHLVVENELVLYIRSSGGYKVD